MNYALDALWWRLNTPEVRHLASLLTAPPPWHSDCELPIRLLLGQHGFRYLLALDEQPAPLIDYLKTFTPFNNRLSIYAECLLAFWFEYAPHTELLSQNLYLCTEERVIRELDFIVRIESQIFHIKLMCQYYGFQKYSETKLIALNTKDLCRIKADKLKHQFDLLTGYDFCHESITKSASVIRGMIFTPDAQPLVRSELNRLGWIAYCLNDWTLIEKTLLTNQNNYFALIDEMNLLAPLKIEEKQTINWKDLQKINRGFIAILEPRPDGYFHEIQRILKF